MTVDRFESVRFLLLHVNLYDFESRLRVINPILCVSYYAIAFAFQVVFEDAAQLFEAQRVADIRRALQQ